METYQYIMIGVVVALILLFFILKNRKKEEECPIDLDTLLEALGGKDNISSIDFGPSTLKVKLINNDIQEDIIKSLGATGIVQGSSQVTMIFGKVSETIYHALEKRLTK